MSDRFSRDDRTPAATVNTATDRELGHDRGLGVGYLDVAIDALIHLQKRTGPGRVWVVSDDHIEDVLQRLTGWREELLRKEKTDTRSRAAELQTDAPGGSDLLPWNRRGVRE